MDQQQIAAANSLTSDEVAQLIGQLMMENTILRKRNMELERLLALPRERESELSVSD